MLPPPLLFPPPREGGSFSSSVAISINLCFTKFTLFLELAAACIVRYPRPPSLSPRSLDRLLRPPLLLPGGVIPLLLAACTGSSKFGRDCLALVSVLTPAPLAPAAEDFFKLMGTRRFGCSGGSPAALFTSRSFSIPAPALSLADVALPLLIISELPPGRLTALAGRNALILGFIFGAAIFRFGVITGELSGGASTFAFALALA